MSNSHLVDFLLKKAEVPFERFELNYSFELKYIEGNT